MTYNASNNELVRTKTLVKGAIVQVKSTMFYWKLKCEIFSLMRQVDATPFRQWYVTHYGQELGAIISQYCHFHEIRRLPLTKSSHCCAGKKALSEEEKKFSKTQLKKFEARR